MACMSSNAKCFKLYFGQRYDIHKFLSEVSLDMEHRSKHLVSSESVVMSALSFSLIPENLDGCV